MCVLFGAPCLPFKLVTDTLESIFPEVGGEDGERVIRAVLFEERMEERENLREQDCCLQIFEELLSGRGVRLVHGLQEAKTSACSTQEIQLLKAF